MRVKFGKSKSGASIRKYVIILIIHNTKERVEPIIINIIVMNTFNILSRCTILDMCKEG